jgi:hypothetical protein
MSLCTFGCGIRRTRLVDILCIPDPEAAHKRIAPGPDSKNL